ncbi:hypothetical protein B9T33_06445 [Acinetobacter sp. ANC 5054]|uniref:hypothetical protein n=1 Tax=Acinetobacter sp. ANC 5054 TaxID=1977877 RepID=UPI000A34343B|nr:hypothetical protein [Acinetobacter sp. ANC 5054]OTG81301.1 hypothetical protein B9T33_06445 [Acinetobacter sp. ANC 5054]
MDNRQFKLKRSVMSHAFQFFIFAVLMTLLYQVVSPMIWGIFFGLGLVVYLLFFRRVLHVSSLEYLDGQDWSLHRLHQPVQRVQISHIFDHQLYIVVYFMHARAKPVIIWRDQLSLKQWKSLKVLAKMI